jgi:hypothetical protein
MMPVEGVKLKLAPVHTVLEKPFGCGAGFNVTVKVKVEAQAPAAVLTVYTAEVTDAVVLVSVPVILF